jgi:hypothetical protein
MEKDAAELRARQQQERENLHNQTIRDLDKEFAETKNQLMVQSPLSPLPSSLSAHLLFPPLCCPLLCLLSGVLCSSCGVHQLELRQMNDEKIKAMKDGELKLQRYRQQRDEEMSKYTRSSPSLTSPLWLTH